MPKTKKKSAMTKSSRKKAKTEVPSLTDEEKRVVMISYEKENDAEGAEELLAEYLKFMHMKIQDKETHFAPSTRIDAMWHAHILSTKQYFSFCDRHNGGEYIHHDPTMTDVPNRYGMTWRKYEELFGHSPKNQAIWPPSESSEPEEEDYSDEYGDYIDDMGCG